MTAVDTTLHTERLDLMLMTPAFFAAAISGDQAQAAQLLGVPIPAEWWPVSHYTLDRVAQALHNPALQALVGTGNCAPLNPIHGWQYRRSYNSRSGKLFPTSK